MGKLQKPISMYSKYIDHSPLKMDATQAEVLEFCREAVEHDFHSLVVYPHYIDLAHKALENSDIKLITVVGFPFGTEITDIKASQARRYMAAGVDEIDMVMNISAFKSGDIDHVKRDIEAVLEEVKKEDGLLKVIIEIELLTDDQILIASGLVAEVGADFVKTSVGLLKTSKPAEVDKVRLMHQAVRSTITKVKASGKIHTAENFLSMIEAGASRIGTTKGIEILEQLKLVQS